MPAIIQQACATFTPQCDRRRPKMTMRFSACAECGVAVANALPALKGRTGAVMNGVAGEGARELIGSRLKDDLRSRTCGDSPCPHEQWRSLPEISIVAADPILTARSEQVDRDRILQCFYSVRRVGRNFEHLTRAKLLYPVSENELELSLQQHGELLIWMAVLGNDAPFTQTQAPESHVGAVNHLP